MKNEIYFEINGVKLYLDFMLEEYDFVPVFYICRDEQGNRYAVWCTDFEKEAYAIVAVTLVQLNDMLQGMLDIRDLFLEQPFFWSVNCVGDSYEDDVVIEHDIREFPVDTLPEPGFKYRLFDQSHKDYAAAIQAELQKYYEAIPVQFIHADHAEKEFVSAEGMASIDFVDVIGEFSIEEPDSFQKYSVVLTEGLAA